MVEFGEGLLEEVLVFIFCYLFLRDCVVVVRVCRVWVVVVICSVVWYDIKISCECELEGMLLFYLFVCFDYIYNLWLEFELLRKLSCWVVIELLMVLVGCVLGL